MSSELPEAAVGEDPGEVTNARPAGNTRLLVSAATHGGDSRELRRLVSSDNDLADLLTRLQDHHWRIEKSELQICVRPDGHDDVLAQGAFGTVYRGILNKSLTVAIKRLTNSHAENKVAFVEEVVCLMNLRHPNIVQFFGSVLEESVIMIVTEYMPRGSVHDAISREELPWHPRGQKIALDVVRGLMYMHGRNAIHQDLKSRNVLLARDWQAKLCDMGLCTLPKMQEEHQNGGKVGTLEYAAPELLNGDCKSASKASDIYSLGVILWELVTLQHPEKRNLQIRATDNCPEEVAELIKQCTSPDPNDRPSIDQVFHTLSGKAPPPSRPLGEQDSEPVSDDALPSGRPGPG